MSKSLFVLGSFLCMIGGTSGASCALPAPSANFSKQSYGGVWYEIAKFQTAGGAFFEKDCVCTQLNVTSDGDKYAADNLCRSKVPTGKLTSAVGTLSDTNTYGRFTEKFFFLAPAVDYTIFLLGTYEPTGEDYSVEYDCGSTLGFLNYCVHFLSRSPTMSTELLNYLIDQVNAAKLNVNNLALQMTKQEGCWNNNNEAENVVAAEYLR